jgi:membrane protein
MGAFLPGDAVGILTDYAERTLRGRPTGALLFATLLLLGSGSAASQAVVKAADRAYGVRETRPFWRLWGISVVMILGLALLVGALGVAAFGPEAGRYAQKLAGLPENSPIPWAAIRWAVAFLAVTLALAVLYYLAPNADLPFAWITPGGFAATVLMLVSSAGLSLYVSNVGRYDQVYGQLGAVVVLMLWLYVTGLVVLLGAEANAVLARMAEERKGEKLVKPQGPEDGADV